MAQRGQDAAAGARPAARSSGRQSSARQASARSQASGQGPAGRTGPDLAGQRDRVRAVIEPVVAAAGLDLEDLTVSPAGRRHVVRVAVDGDGGVGHDTLGEISRNLSAALDAAEESGGELTSTSYTLEVSSPGVDRPLTLPRHWRRNIGRLVKVRVAGRTLTARIAAVDEAGVTLDADGTDHSVTFDQLGPGRVQVEFTRLADLADEEFEEVYDDGEEMEDGA